MPALEFEGSGGGLAPVAATPARPLSVVDNAEGPINIHATVPRTGEKYYQWFSRRLQLLGDTAPDLGAHLLVELASQPYTDSELGGIAKAISSIYGFIPSHLAKRINQVRSANFANQEARAREAYKGAPDLFAPEEKPASAAEAYTGQLEGARPPSEAEIATAFLGTLGEGLLTGADLPYRAVTVPIATGVELGVSGVRGESLSPREAWRRAVKLGPGRAVAEAAGLEPGSKPYEISSASLDFLARWFLDPTVIGAKASRGARLAERIPLLGAEASIPERSLITKFVYEKLAKPPELLIREPVAQGGIDAMWGMVQRESNVNALIDRFHLPSDMAQDVASAASKGEVEQITLDYLAGRGRMNAGASGQRTILRQVPEDTRWGRLRDEFKRGDLGHYTARFTDPNRLLRRPFQNIPNQAISITNKESGRVQVQRLAELLGFDQPGIDRHVNAYLSASTRDGVRRSVFDMLKEGRARLPEGVGGEVTQVYDDLAGSAFYVGDDGARLWTKARTAGGGRGAVFDALPHLETEVAWEIPLPNVERIRELTSLGGKIRTAVERLASKAGVPKIGLGITETWRDVNRLVSWYTSQVFKPLALLRVGWPMKVVGEEQLRLAALDVPSMYHSPLDWFKNLRLAKTLNVPEGALTDVGRALIETRSAKSVVRFGEKGFAEGWHGELQQLRDSKVVRRILEKGEAATVRWLTAGEGRVVLEGYQGVLDEAGATVDDWVRSVAERIETKARTPELREALKRGYVKDASGLKIDLDSDQFRDLLKTFDESAAPIAVKNLYDEWRKVGNGYQRVVTRLMDVLGSKPTNTLSRAPAWTHFYKAEKRRLSGLLGASQEALVERSAREYATGQVKRILFEIGERSAMHQTFKNSAPFLNAFQEVGERWLAAIPAEYGPLGRAYVVQRARAVKEVAEDLGILKKNEDGKWIVDVPGLEAALRLVPGLEGVKAEIPLERLSMFGQMPFSGPALTFPVATYIKATEKTNALFDLMLPYGPETTLGPVWMNRAWRATFGSLPPWERTMPSASYQETLWDAALVDWMRHDEASNGTLSKISKISDPEQRAEAIEDWVETAKGKARGIFAVRAALNFFSPASPQLYWREEREMVAFRKKLLALSESDRKKAVDRLFEERPGLEAYFAAKSFRMKGEQPREYKQEEYWKDWRNGNIKRYKPEEWAEVASGFLVYSSIRRDAREKLSDIGSDAASWLRNANEYLEVNSERRLAQARLAKDNPKWATAFQRVIENAAKREGRPMPGFEEQVALDFAANVRNISALLRGKEDVDVDWGALSQARRVISEQFKLERFYSNKELPEGPEKDVAWYWENVFGPYLEEISGRFKDAKFKPADEQARLYESIRKFSNNQEAKTYNGLTFPTPEQVLYYMQDGEQREETKTKWALRPVSYLTTFQRKTLGLSDSQQAISFWDAVSNARAETTQYIRDKGWISQQREAKNMRASLAAWEVQLAKRMGMGSEYALSEAVPYQRVRFFDQGIGVAWRSFYENADAVLQATSQKGFGAFSKAGNPYRQALYGWLTQQRRSDTGFDKDLRVLQTLSRYKGEGSTDKFYDWFVFGVLRP